MDFIEHEAIFKFIHNLILVSLEETDLKRSKRIFETFLARALEINTKSSEEISSENLFSLERGEMMDTCNEYVLQIFKQIYDNANTDKNYRVIFFVDSFIRVNVISLFIERIQQSPLMAKELSEEKLSSSTDFSAIMAEQEVLQYYLKSLTFLIKIFSKMNKTRKTDQQKMRESQYYGGELNNANSNQTEQQINGQNKVMKEFSSQLNLIFIKLPQLSHLVKTNQYRVTPFSSGQNIKPITMCKYQFFELLYNCLLLSKQLPQSFVLDTERINIFSIIERYLQQNRWNNLAHKVLEKIACLLIMNNKNFFRTKEMNKNNMADQFLNTIIESFTNKKHIFLKSLRFTSQGNLQALYTIAKAIISKMKQSHNLANFVHQLDYYKKFVMQDLQSYQKRIKEVQVILSSKKQYPADNQDMNTSDKSADQNDQVKLYVDELSVSQIIKKIEVVNKWPLKQTKRKHGSFIHRSLSYMSDQHHQTSSTIVQRKRIKPLPPSQQLLNTDQDEQNDEALHQKLIKTESPRGYMKSEVKDLSKSSQEGSTFFKQHFKRTQSKMQQIQSNSIRQHGKGLFGVGFTGQPKSTELFPDLKVDSKLQKGNDDKKTESTNARIAENKKRKQFEAEQNEQKGFFSAQKRKSRQQEEEEFNFSSPCLDSTEELKINIISSDKKLVKNISIQEKNHFEEFDDKQDKNKAGQSDRPKQL